MNKRLKKKMAKKAAQSLVGRQDGIWTITDVKPGFEEHLMQLGEEIAIKEGLDLTPEIKAGYHKYMMDKISTMPPEGVDISLRDYLKELSAENIKYCHHCNRDVECEDCKYYVDPKYLDYLFSVIDPRD